MKRKSFVEIKIKISRKYIMFVVIELTDKKSNNKGKRKMGFKKMNQALEMQ